MSELSKIGGPRVQGSCTIGFLILGRGLLLLVVVPWGCDFMGCDFKGCDFKGCDLKNHLKTI